MTLTLRNSKFYQYLTRRAPADYPHHAKPHLTVEGHCICDCAKCSAPDGTCICRRCVLTPKDPTEEEAS